MRHFTQSRNALTFCCSACASFFATTHLRHAMPLRCRTHRARCGVGEYVWAGWGAAMCTAVNGRIEKAAQQRRCVRACHPPASECSIWRHGAVASSPQIWHRGSSCMDKKE